MDEDFFLNRFNDHQRAGRLPSPKLVEEWLDGLLQFLFPEYCPVRFASHRAFRLQYQTNDLKLFTLLESLEDRLKTTPADIREDFEACLSSIFRALSEDADAILAGDPAAQDRTEVI
ncbi:MAG: serine O-acetyltransferase, partial [Neolewinella sp.]